MSHYTVAVFHKKNQRIEELLAPYEECIAIDPNDKLSKQIAAKFARRIYPDCEKLSDKECLEKLTKEHKPDKDGFIYIPNGEGKWDWWSIGGRWHSSLVLKDFTKKADSALVKNIDFSMKQSDYDDALELWDIVVDGKKSDKFITGPTDKKDKWVKTYGTRETFARINASFHTYAVITPDGEWHAQGEMGWFGISSATTDEERDWREHYKERFLDTADPNWILTIVDCHI